MKKSPSQLDLFDIKSQDSSPDRPEGGVLTIFQSSAGSGKTFTLVKEYLKIILKDPSNFSHVLAVTFTNAATKEMKYRILDDLEDIAHGKLTPMRKAIDEDFKEELKDHLPVEKRANDALNNILYNYGHFDVSTIDHFFTRVVRALAYELKQPIKYDIDVDNERAVENAIEKLFNSVHANPETRNWLKEFALSRLDEDKGWYIEFSLLELGMQLFQEKFREYFDDEASQIDLEQLRELVDGLTFIKESYTADLRTLARKALDLIKEHGLKAYDLSGGSKGVGNGFYKILDGDYKLNKTFLDACQGYRDWYAQKSLKRDKIKQLADSGLNTVGKQIAEHYTKFHKPYVTANELLKNIYSYGLMGEMHKNLQEYKLENNLLLLADIGSLLRKVIGDHDAPFIYEKLGSRYKHLLIDEFQDTSNFQWVNLRPLVMNSLSNNNRVYLAGDVKQSIYRWRGGNLHLILSDVKEDLQQIATVKEEPLKTNYRSGQNIINFNNSFFETASRILKDHPEVDPSDELVSMAYKVVTQETFKKNEGYVEVNLIEKPEDGDRYEWHRIAREKTADVINECLNDGFNYKDILILVDAGWLGNQMADFLITQEVPVITENSLSVENNQKVKMLLSVFRWFEDPKDFVARAAILHHHFELKGEESSYLEHKLYARALQEDFFLNEVPKELIKNLQRLKQLPLYELVEELIIIFSLNSPPDVFVQKFQDLCLSLAARGVNSIAGFFNWWEKKITRKDKYADLAVKVPSETNAVEITTIHQAKGLQRPIVIVPFAGDNFEMKTKDSIFWTRKLPEQFQQFQLLPLRFNNQLLDSDFSEAYRTELMEGIVDRLNVAYVAFTRAEERLYVFSNANKKHEDPYGNLHRLIYGVFTDLEFEFQANFDQQAKRLVLGKKEKKGKQEETKSEIEHVEAFPSRLYSDKVTVRKDSHKFFLLFDNETANKIREGIVVHAAMELISSESEVALGLDRLSASGLLSGSQRKTVEAKVESILSKTDINQWIESGWNPIRENEIFSQGEIYKPDLVLIKDEQAIVVDYKREQRSKKHQDQIKNYGQLLTSMNYQIEKLLLIYLDEFEVEEVEV